MTKRILTHGRIYTVNEAQPWAEAIVIDGNRIAFVGDNTSALAYAGDGDSIEDLGGRFVMPGIIDGHVHPFMAICFNGLIRVSPADDLVTMQQRIAEFIAAHPDLNAYMGWGWNDSYFGADGPVKADLDAVCADKPVTILSASGHCGWCNSKALEAASVDKNTPDPDPSSSQVYIRDEAGNPTGYLKETAPTNHVLGAAEYIDMSILAKSANWFAGLCASYGITSLVDCGNFEFAERLMDEDLCAVFNNPACPVRLCCSGKFANKANAQSALDEAVRLRKKYNNDRVRCGFYKIINDGTAENSSAAFPNPDPGMPKVLPVMSADELFHWGEQAAKAGLDLNVHSIGTLTVHALLEAAGRLRAAGYDDLRVCCSHTGYVFPDDVAKFAEYNVTANSTAKWFCAEEDEATEKWADNITQGLTYPMNSIRKAGGRLSLSSDYPTDLTALNPMLNFEIALTRQSAGDANWYINQPAERLTLDEVIKAYTINNAYLMRMEDRLGSLEPGKYADLIVLDRNPFEMGRYEIHEIKVVESIMDGRKVNSQ